MAIQPIDLQTMYSQMANVASKVTLEQHGAQMTASIQMQSAMLQNAESVKTVKKTAGEDSKTDLIKDGKSNSSKSENNKKNDETDEETENPKTEFREDFLGKHIDITR